MQENEEKDFDDFEEYRENKIKEKKLLENAQKHITIFSKVVSFFIKITLVSAILIGLAVIIIAFVKVYASLSVVAPKNVLKSLEEEYDGEKFEIIEDFGAKDSSSRGLYIVSPKSNKNIQFKMLNTTKFINEDDYSAQRTKYYIEHCKDKKLLEGVKVDENTVTSQGVEFLHYTLFIELNDYDEIEEKTEKAYKLAKYLHSQDSRMFEPIFLDMTTVNVSLITINCNTEKSLEEEIYSAKYKYIQTLDANNKKEEMQKIGSKEINKIWKPEYLQLIVNEKATTVKTQYDLEDKEYHIVNITNFFEQIDKIEIAEKNTFSKEIEKIKYNGKTYQIKQGQNSGKNENNIIYTEEGINSIIEKFNGSIKYDYYDKKIYVTM